LPGGTPGPWQPLAGNVDPLVAYGRRPAPRSVAGTTILRPSPAAEITIERPSRARTAIYTCGV